MRDHALTALMASMRIARIVILHARSLRGSELRIFPHHPDMLRMQVQMCQELHALDICWPIIEAIEVLVMPHECAVERWSGAAPRVERIRQMVDELVLAGGWLLDAQIVVHAFTNRRGIEIARHEA
ncbi:MAG TPA: hypothetical protein VLJ14_15920, partial [Ktedonobacterales bacterium]|nr:hypothetical protein [Ktedonobacterales bacterium]